MKTFIFTLLLVLPFISINSVEIGQVAPDFKLTGAKGTETLSKHKGKYVVLEWFNDGCPFVRKHYDSKNMQNLQAEFKDKVTWLAINSSAPGKQGDLIDQNGAKKMYNKEQIKAMNLLIDRNGTVGKQYKATTTPHMFIIDPEGKLVYQGAIDSNPSYDSKDIPKSKNYVKMALNSALAGKAIKRSKTEPYGCSVKY